MRTFEPYLMILMRNDLNTMTGGRAAAQASHATSDFTIFAENIIVGSIPSEQKLFASEYRIWKNSTKQNFGTTIVAGVNEKQMREFVDEAEIHDFQANIINDPTYGVKDGAVTHYVSVDTCAWVFVHTNNSPFFDDLKLLPLF